MMRYFEDPMWDEFKQLWHDLLQIEESILVAGGYGLFLKQKWLLTNPELPTIIPILGWPDATPRVTYDFDFVMALEVIASEETQVRVRQILEKHHFSPKAPNHYWQFEKEVSGPDPIVVDLHAPLPPDDYPGVKRKGTRIKRQPSLGEAGIHGRTNPEAVGCELSPVEFELDNLRIIVPNPVTWCIMKLTAMHERYDLAHDDTVDEDTQIFCMEQAVKHAQDVCRIVAMVTREERDEAGSVLEAIADTEQLAIAKAAFQQFFQTDTDWGSRTVANQWAPDDLAQIQSTLAEWFAS